MRIMSIGGGPAGLYLAVPARQQGHEVVVHERLSRGVSQGWGVVFWDDLLDQMRSTDPVFAERLVSEAFEWHDQVITITGRAPQTIPSSGFSIARHRLLELLAERAEEVGVDLRFGSDAGPAEAAAADLVIAADGVRSPTRDAQPAFGTALTQLENRFMWLGTDRVFDSFEFPVRRVDHGWIWGHAYGFSPTMSTFVVETTPETWRAEGFDRLDGDATLRRLEAVFADRLDGARLLQPPAATGAPWRRFDFVRNERWAVGSTVLLGDAAHTTHFSIGSGTRLALEDAIALSAALRTTGSAAEAAAAYDAARRPQLEAVQAQALNSARWFEQLPKFVERGGDRIAELLERRRSGLVTRLPLPVYLGAMRVSEAVPVARPAARAIRRALHR